MTFPLRGKQGVMPVQLGMSRCPQDICIQMGSTPCLHGLGKRNSGLQAMYTKQQKVLYLQLVFGFQCTVNFEIF